LSSDYLGSEVNGSSPPTVFVGRIGYPNIRVYPSAPPIIGDTSFLEKPSKWLDMSLEEFIGARLSLVRGGILYKASSARNPDKVLSEIQEIAMSHKPIHIYMSLASTPKGGFFSEETPPLGPWAPLKKLELSDTPKIERVVEKVYQDTDLRASQAIYLLYRGGLSIEKISSILSVGAIGRGRYRRLVPTRWAITAVDSLVSERLLDEIKTFPEISEYRVFIREVRGNLFTAILIPSKWMFEWGEAWFPGSTWNPWGLQVEIEIDYEGNTGRSDYPSIGGCYYASRLAVAEYLYRLRRQAAAILWREIYPGFTLPIGVWFVRENIRKMLSEEPIKVSSFSEALKIVSEKLRVPLDKWISKSFIAKLFTGSKRLDEYTRDRRN
jgi:hypothetical protein